MSSINSPRNSSPPTGLITQVTKESLQQQQQQAIQLQSQPKTPNKAKKRPWFSLFSCCMTVPDEGQVSSASAGASGSNQPYHSSSTSQGSHHSTLGGSHTSFTGSGSGICLLSEPIQEDINRKTLVLDLDETLVHSSFKPITNADFIIPVEIEDQVHQVYVLKRPGVDQFMKFMGERFEVVVFTASLSKYADPVLDLLDIHKVVRQRLFREACVDHKGNFVKDLSRLGRELKNTVIIDNSPMSYLFHPMNALAIGSWFDDPSDTELLDMMSYLDELSKCDDVVQLLEKNRK